MPSKKKSNVISLKEAADIRGRQLAKDNDEIVDREIAQGIVDTIQKMVEDRTAKCEAAKNQLVENLEITADKYRTATGVHEALRVIRSILSDPAEFDSYTSIGIAKTLASNMSATATKMAEKAKGLGFMEMDQLCDGFYDKDFASNDSSAMDMAEEIMRLDLCRNVGPAAEDMVSFQKRVEEEIKASQDKLDELCKKHPEFKKLAPTPKE